MTDENEEKRVLRGEILPASPRAVSLAPDVAHLPQGVLGMGMFARARYASERKQIEAFNRLVHAKNDLLRALDEQQELLVGYAIGAERVRNLDKLRETERAKIGRELAAIHNAAELDGLRHESEKERLLLEIEQRRKARQGFAAPAAAPQPTKKSSLSDDFSEVGREIDKIEQAYQDLKAELIRRVGGESNLTRDQSDRLGQFELLRNKLINDAMEALV